MGGNLAVRSTRGHRSVVLGLERELEVVGVTPVVDGLRHLKGTLNRCKGVCDNERLVGIVVRHRRLERVVLVAHHINHNVVCGGVVRDAVHAIVGFGNGVAILAFGGVGNVAEVDLGLLFGSVLRKLAVVCGASGHRCTIHTRKREGELLGLAPVLECLLGLNFGMGDVIIDDVTRQGSEFFVGLERNRTTSSVARQRLKHLKTCRGSCGCVEVSRIHVAVGVCIPRSYVSSVHDEGDRINLGVASRSLRLGENVRAVIETLEGEHRVGTHIGVCLHDLRGIIGKDLLELELRAL